MTDDQFKSLAYLMRLRKGSASSKALELFYVQELSPTECQAQSGLTPQSFFNAVQRSKRTMKAVKELCSQDLMLTIRRHILEELDSIACKIGQTR